MLKAPVVCAAEPSYSRCGDTDVSTALRAQSGRIIRQIGWYRGVCFRPMTDGGFLFFLRIRGLKKHGMDVANGFKRKIFELF